MLGNWSTARPDWEKRIIAGQSILPEALPINRQRAERALSIFKLLVVSDVIGKPTLGESSPEWMFDLVYVVFGCYDPETRRQLIKEVFILISKKNGKSTLAAGLMMTALIMNKRNMGEYLIVAPTKDVANNSFDPAYGMIREDPELTKIYKGNTNTREIVNILDGTVLAVKSADADVIGGQKAIVTFVDELWLFGKKPQGDNIMSEATGSQAARKEGFVIYASTQSDEPPTGVFKKKLDYFRGIRDGTIVNRSALPVIFEYPKSMLRGPKGIELQPWRDPATWRITNPSLGAIVDEEFLTSEMTKMQNEGLSSLSIFIAKHFNVESGLGLKSGSWAGAEFWLGDPETGMTNVDTTITVDEIIRRCDVITIGIDGGGLDDLLGFAVMGRVRGTGKFLLWNHAWAHHIVKDRRTDIASKLQELSDAKELTFVQNPDTGFWEMAKICRKIAASGLLPAKLAIGVDSFGLAKIVEALVKEDDETGEMPIAREQIEGIQQGWKLNGAIKGTEVDLASGNIKHPGLALMTWAVANCRAVAKGNAVTIDKQESGWAKIDPVMATLHANVLMGLNPEAQGISGWNTEDVDGVEDDIEAEMAKIEAEEQAAELAALRDQGIGVY